MIASHSSTANDLGSDRRIASNRPVRVIKGEVVALHLALSLIAQQQGAGLAVRKYTMMKRGILSHDAQRLPGSTITAAAKAEVDYLLERVAKTDPRANS